MAFSVAGQSEKTPIHGLQTVKVLPALGSDGDEEYAYFLSNATWFSGQYCTRLALPAPCTPNASTQYTAQAPKMVQSLCQ